MYIKHSRLPKWKMGQLVTEWIYATPARVAAKKLHLHRNTVNLWYGRIRKRILLLPPPPSFSGEVEVDETYLGEKRPGVTGRGTFDRVAVFGILERKTKQVFATVVKETGAGTLLPIICRNVYEGTTIYSDGHGAYRHLDLLGYRHFVVPHAYTFSRGYGVHSNGIESFWAYLQHLFYMRRGLPRKLYEEHVQEAVFRFNNRDPHVRRVNIKRILNFYP